MERHLVSYKYAVRGVWLAFRSEYNMRIHLAAAVGVILVNYQLFSMKFREIFRFEFRYQLRHVSTWLLFAVFLLFGFMILRMVTLTDETHLNAPWHNCLLYGLRQRDMGGNRRGRCRRCGNPGPADAYASAYLHHAGEQRVTWAHDSLRP
jgi:hypothetical protein